MEKREIRCGSCERLAATVVDGDLEIPCQCGTVNRILAGSLGRRPRPTESRNGGGSGSGNGGAKGGNGEHCGPGGSSSH